MATEGDRLAYPEMKTDFLRDPVSDQPYSNIYSYGGMTLREYYAGQALAGLMSIPARIVIKDVDRGTWLQPTQFFHPNTEYYKVAQEADKAADAMMAIVEYRKQKETT